MHDGAPDRLRVPLLDSMVDRVHARLLMASLRIVKSLSGLRVCLVCGVRLIVTSVLICRTVAFDRERCLRPRVVRFACLLVCVVNGEKVSRADSVEVSVFAVRAVNACAILCFVARTKP